MNTYRIFMRDGYAGIYNADSEAEAKQQAVATAKQACEHVAMTDRERKTAATVKSVEKLNS